MSRGSDAEGRSKPQQDLEGRIPRRKHYPGHAPSSKGTRRLIHWSRGHEAGKDGDNGGSSNHDFFFLKVIEVLKEEECC